MSPEQIKVKLDISGENDTLIFFVDEVEHPQGIKVDLNSTKGQHDLKHVFSALLKKMETSEIKLQLEVAEEYSKVLYKEVCDEYIKSLNDELSTVYNKIHEELIK